MATPTEALLNSPVASKDLTIPFKSTTGIALRIPIYYLVIKE